MPATSSRSCGCLHLGIARRAAPARDEARDRPTRRPPRRRRDRGAAVGDQRAQPRAAEPVDGKQIVDARGRWWCRRRGAARRGRRAAHRADRADRRMPRAASARSPARGGRAWCPARPTGRRGRGGGSRRSPRSRRWRKPPGTHTRARSAGPPGGGDGVGERRRASEERAPGSRRRRLAEALAIGVEHAALVPVPRRPARSSVGSSGSSTAATRPSRASIGRSQANSHSAAAFRSLALQMSRPCDVVIACVPLIASRLAAGIRHRRRHPVARLTDWEDEPEPAVRERLSARVRPRRRVHDPARDRRPASNARRCSRRRGNATTRRVAVAVFPELCLSG